MAFMDTDKGEENGHYLGNDMKEGGKTLLVTILDRSCTEAESDCLVVQDPCLQNGEIGTTLQRWP
jgi:hypothetical protein